MGSSRVLSRISAWPAEERRNMNLLPSRLCGKDIDYVMA